MHLDFTACRDLDPAQFKLLAAFAHHADPAGKCRVLQADLAAEMGISASTVCRWTAELVQRGCLTRARIAGGTYRYRISVRFLVGDAEKYRERYFPDEAGAAEAAAAKIPHNRGISETAKTDRNRSISEIAKTSRIREELHPVKLHTVKSGIAHAASADAGALTDAPALVTPSSELRSSEGEHALSQDKIPEGWEEAAAAERRLAGLGPVNLRAEWRKLVARVEGQPITIWRWRGWVLKARGDAASAKNANHLAVSESVTASDAFRDPPGDERQQARARSWARTGRWAPPGLDWGPAPDQPDCSLPAALVAWCLRERAAAAA